MSIDAVLAVLPQFATVERGQLATLVKHAEELDVPAGVELTHEGRHEGSLFIVVSGSIGIERGGRTVDTIGRGGFFGEIAAGRGGPRPAPRRAGEGTRGGAVSPPPPNAGPARAAGARG